VYQSILNKQGTVS
jgi:hypothetical protein